MSEERATYHTLLHTESNSGTLNANSDLYTLRAELIDLERRLIPLLIAVQRALGKEPSLMTRLEKRGD